MGLGAVWSLLHFEMPFTASQTAALQLQRGTHPDRGKTSQVSHTLICAELTPCSHRTRPPKHPGISVFVPFCISEKTTGCLAPRGKIFVLLIHSKIPFLWPMCVGRRRDVPGDELRHRSVSQTHQWQPNTTSLGRCHLCSPCSYTQTQTPHLVTANFLTRGVSGQSHISALRSAC